DRRAFEDDLEAELRLSFLVDFLHPGALPDLEGEWTDGDVRLVGPCVDPEQDVLEPRLRVRGRLVPRLGDRRPCRRSLLHERVCRGLLLLLVVARQLLQEVGRVLKRTHHRATEATEK